MINAGNKTLGGLFATYLLLILNTFTRRKMLKIMKGGIQLLGLQSWGGGGGGHQFGGGGGGGHQVGGSIEIPKSDKCEQGGGGSKFW